MAEIIKINDNTWRIEDGFVRFSQLPKSGDKIRFTGEALKQISNMQILDYLSGNVDRHIGNMLYKTEMGKDGKLYITGVMGIDDDASFGKVKSAEQFAIPVQDNRSIIGKLRDNPPKSNQI